jgi:hypothetical protein
MNQQKKKNIYWGGQKLVGVLNDYENLLVVGLVVKTKKNYCRTEY